MEITKSLFNNGNKLVEFTAENFNYYLSDLNKFEEPKTDEENEEIENRYLSQLNIKVKSYHDGNSNIVEFL